MKDAKIAVVGCRRFTDWLYVRSVLDQYYDMYGVSWLISGGTPGVDTIAVNWALDRGIFGYSVYIAQWHIYGNRAGYRRNLLIVESSDVVLAFPSQYSKGTYHTINLAKRFNKPVAVFKVES